jgi:hypothetical protein
MHQHEMQQSNIYLGIYIIVFYFFWKIGVLHPWPHLTTLLLAGTDHRRLPTPLAEHLPCSPVDCQPIWVLGRPVLAQGE